MKMNIKAKITFGVGMLFFLIVLLAAVSGWYVNQLKRDTNNILVANYNTLQYANNMLTVLDELDTDPVAVNLFKENLDKQSRNMTEIGERDATQLILQHLQALEQKPDDPVLIAAIRTDITELMRLNMGAIERKSDIADDTAHRAIVIISITGALCFLIAFVLLVNLPSSIADPITELSASIKEIANQNYKKRVFFSGHREFGELAQSFNTMAEKLEEYADSKLDKLLKSKKRIDTLIERMHDPVIGTDEDEVILFANEQACKVTGMKNEELIGRSIRDLVLHNDLLRDVYLDWNRSVDAIPGTKTLKIYADGKESYFEKELVNINIVPTGEEGEQFIGRVILLKNITAFKEMDLAKTNFIGTVSHEFKTPIASIKLGIQLLENKQVGELNEEQNGLVLGIKDDLQRLLDITGELLNMAQVESGAIQMNVASTEVRPIVEYAVEANRAAMDQRHIQVVVDIDEPTAEVQADSEKTAWVLTNLLSNALRYSHDESRVYIHVYSKEDKIWFAVRDTGQGILPEYMDKIFHRYFRVPGSKKEGTGLGLSISKEFIEAQGGTITVESEYGVGSVFSFCLKKS
ncbi:ATP-binding protein [Sphingobacterium yanglingense]|uniref:histidine kinase n=1 Tax=Sphingobacterium yanglingense TaxID=1437280 RepID=A0A4R6WHP3_9SPHI|nr:ATP-binding protein [Sphingobacterium yanglingense]TDQ77861.1 PAS/PAC sensor signal transduction histidine kinase [Sphingobacterium yanglingense]